MDTCPPAIDGGSRNAGASMKPLAEGVNSPGSFSVHRQEPADIRFWPQASRGTAACLLRFTPGFIATILLRYALM
ncbi:hypothetical protein AGIG_G16384 [Arapaima gigas]